MKESKIVRRAGDMIFKGFIINAIATGKLDPEKLSDEDIYNYGIECMKHAGSGGKVAITMDYTRSLLTRARADAKSFHQDFALVFYATWVEHTLNQWISCYYGGGDIAKSVIRDTGIGAKYIWATKVFCGRIPSKLQQNRLVRVSSYRNQIIHYKWGDVPLDNWNSKDEAVLIGEAEKLVKSMQTFTAKYIMKGANRRIRRITVPTNSDV